MKKTGFEKKLKVNSAAQLRHEDGCTVCKHPRRQEIEDAFCDWSSLGSIADEFTLNRNAISRHANATGLRDKRRCNLRTVLERIIEGSDDNRIKPTVLINAVCALAKINARGEWVERTQPVNYNDVFSKMSTEELKRYVMDGAPPSALTERGN
jgi:hypothetical protein